MPHSERRTYPPLISREALQRLPYIKDVAPLGLNAIANIKLFAEDVPFCAYLCGFDGDDTCYGLMTARTIRLGEMYLSGLDAACVIWDAHLAQDSNFQPTPLRAILIRGTQTHDSSLQRYSLRQRQLGLIVRAQVCLVLGREYHHPSTYKTD